MVENKEKAICVYGASNDDIAVCYKDAARELGRLVAESGRILVSGGGRGGLMAAAIEGAVAAGGFTVGVLPGFMVERGWQHPSLSRMITTPDMHSRKRTMADLACGVVAMPGGVGTLEELMEIITWRQLGLFAGKVVILNTEGFYNPLLEMLDQCTRLGFMRHVSEQLWSVATTPSEAIKLLDADA